MSSLLEQAIIDAKLLRETARRNAEAALIDEYADEIKKNMDAMLEQDDLGLGALGDTGDLGALGGSDDSGGMDLPPLSSDMAPPAGQEPSKEVKTVINKVPPAYLGGDNLQEVEINLDSIIEKIDSLEKDLNMKSPDFSDAAHEAKPHSNLEKVPSGGLEEAQSVDEACHEEEEEESLEEYSVNGEEEEEESLEEELTIDLQNVSPGGINANEMELKKQYNVIKALEAQNELVNEELAQKYSELDSMQVKLETALNRLKETREKLKKSVELNSTLKEGFQLLTKKVNEVNLLNSRLLYTNKVLGNDSLNERQKKQIAESISKAKTVDEAKTIYETLQRSVDTIVEKRSVPKSLTEAINKAPSAFLPRVNNAIDPNVDRWQRIAGIKK